MSWTESLMANALAESSADLQAKFFNEFYRLLKVSSRGRHEQQVCYIAECLDENGREFADSLNAFAKLAFESRVKIEAEMSRLYQDRNNLIEEIKALEEGRSAGISEAHK
jgi:hypothetical protein